MGGTHSYYEVDRTAYGNGIINLDEFRSIRRQITAARIKCAVIRAAFGNIDTEECVVSLPDAKSDPLALQDAITKSFASDVRVKIDRHFTTEDWSYCNGQDTLEERTYCRNEMTFKV
jgi:hypothetical protein